MPNKLILLFSTVFLLSACAGSPKAYRINCDEEVDAAWNELSIAKAEGFDGTVSYAKALTLITTARTQKLAENFDNCFKNAQKARFYIRESREGR